MLQGRRLPVHPRQPSACSGPCGGRHFSIGPRRSACDSKCPCLCWAPAWPCSACRWPRAPGPGGPLALSSRHRMLSRGSARRSARQGVRSPPPRIRRPRPTTSSIWPPSRWRATTGRSRRWRRRARGPWARRRWTPTAPPAWPTWPTWTARRQRPSPPSSVPWAAAWSCCTATAMPSTACRCGSARRRPSASAGCRACCVWSATSSSR